MLLMIIDMLRCFFFSLIFARKKDALISADAVIIRLRVRCCRRLMPPASSLHVTSESSRAVFMLFAA